MAKIYKKIRLVNGGYIYVESETQHAVRFGTGENQKTTQYEYSMSNDGSVYTRYRTRANTSSSWGSWSGWVNLTANKQNALTVTSYGHTDFTYVDQWTTYYSTSGGNRPTASKYGRIVTLSGTVKTLQARTSTGNWNIGNVPAGCEPLQRMALRQQGSGMNTFLLLINTDGSINIERYGSTSDIAVPSGAFLPINCTYISAT